MQNLLYMHLGSAQLLCSHWCEKNWMSSWNKESSPQWRSPWTGVSSFAYSWKANGKLGVCLDPQRSQQSYQKRPLQDPHCWRDHTSTSRKQEVYQAWWNLIISLHSSWLWIIPSHHIQHTMRKIQVCTPFLGPIMCAQDIFQRMMDQISGMMQGSYWNCWWCCHLWRWWWWWKSWSEPT